MKKLLYLTIGTLLIYSCSKEDISSKSSPVAPSETEVETTDGMTVLGKQLENPYSVNNMRRALANLALATRSGIGEDQIQATHHYVKFHPKTNAELDLLKQDSTILLYEYPLDYDIEVYGTYYHSPEIPDSLPTYQYASIDVEKWDAISKIPVEFTILEELFIPDEDKDDAEPVMTRSGKVLDNALIDALVDEALKITGNDEPKVAVTRASKWRPAGQIMCNSEEKGWIGIEGLKIKARRWFTTHIGFVNAAGYYSCDGTFRRDANYSFDWERYDFEIRWGWLATASYDGPQKKGNWNVWISDDRNHFRTTIFRAAYHYCYKNIKGLSRPPQNSFWKTQLKIRAHYEQSNDVNGYHNAGKRFLGLGSAIHIYNPQNSEREIYGTTIHELAHAAHWGKYKNDYNEADNFVCESWARGVQYFLTGDVYSNYSISQAACAYTPVVLDLVDGANLTKACYGYYYKEGDKWKYQAYDTPKYYNDKVSSYTLSQIEASLSGARNAQQWKNNLKNRYSNVTENNLDETFTFWSNQ